MRHHPASSRGAARLLKDPRACPGPVWDHPFATGLSSLNCFPAHHLSMPSAGFIVPRSHLLSLGPARGRRPTFPSSWFSHGQPHRSSCPLVLIHPALAHPPTHEAHHAPSRSSSVPRLYSLHLLCIGPCPSHSPSRPHLPRPHHTFALGLQPSALPLAPRAQPDTRAPSPPDLQRALGTALHPSSSPPSPRSLLSPPCKSSVWPPFPAPPAFCVNIPPGALCSHQPKPSQGRPFSTALSLRPPPSESSARAPDLGAPLPTRRRCTPTRLPPILPADI